MYLELQAENRDRSTREEFWDLESTCTSSTQAAGEGKRLTRQTSQLYSLPVNAAPAGLTGNRSVLSLSLLFPVDVGSDAFSVSESTRLEADEDPEDDDFLLSLEREADVDSALGGPSPPDAGGMTLSDASDPGSNMSSSM